jgi:hypothetical protein
MNHIKPVFIEYTDLIENFGEKELISRYDTLLKSSNDFIQKMGYSEYVFVNDITLLYAMCDYLSDVLRLKSFHKIERENEVKATAYEVFWLLKRKPLQVKSDSKEHVYVNEQYALSRIVHYLSNNEEETLLTLGNEKLEFFMNTLFYYLKYRLVEPRMLEMFILSFNAGRIFAEELGVKKVETSCCSTS